MSYGFQHLHNIISKNDELSNDQKSAMKWILSRTEKYYSSQNYMISNTFLSHIINNMVLCVGKKNIINDKIIVGEIVTYQTYIIVKDYIIENVITCVNENITEHIIYIYIYKNIGDNIFIFDEADITIISNISNIYGSAYINSNDLFDMIPIREKYYFQSNNERKIFSSNIRKICDKININYNDMQQLLEKYNYVFRDNLNAKNILVKIFDSMELFFVTYFIY